MQVFNRANRMNEVGDLKREALRPPTDPAQIMYYLCSPIRRKGIRWLSHRSTAR